MKEAAELKEKRDGANGLMLLQVQLLRQSDRLVLGSHIILVANVLDRQEIGKLV